MIFNPYHLNHIDCYSWSKCELTCFTCFSCEQFGGKFGECHPSRL